MEEFDENKAIAHMRKAIAESESQKYSDDELLNLIDIIWDFYEQNGLLDVDLNDDEEDDDPEAMISDLVDYAKRMIKKDRRATLDLELIEPLVKAEIEYEDSLMGDI